MNILKNTGHSKFEELPPHTSQITKRIAKECAGLSMFITAMFGSLPAAANPVDDTENYRHRSLTEIEYLTEDAVYLVLFENTDENNKDANLIKKASRYAINAQSPFQWHIEILYYSNSQWLMAGCRPPFCSTTTAEKIASLPAYENNNWRGIYLDGANSAQVVNIMKKYEGKPYSLTNTKDGFNCTDPAADLVKLVTGEDVPKTSREDAKKNPKIKKWLKHYFGAIWEEIQNGGRRHLMFPDSFELFGEYIGNIAFNVTPKMLKEHLKKHNK